MPTINIFNGNPIILEPKPVDKSNTISSRKTKQLITEKKDASFYYMAISNHK